MIMYKKLLAYAVAIALAVTGITFVPSAKKAQAAADPTDGKWQLQWSDEFDGNSLNTNTWTYEQGAGGWGNGEVQYYTNRTQNVFVQDGLLNIRAQRENYNGSQFTSGRIITKNKKTFKYGKMEAKLRVNGGNQDGVWPAFWMMGNDIDRVGWPACGELDIMEHANNNAFIGGTLHFGPSWDQHGMWGSGDTGQNKYFSDNTNNGINGWHTYGVTWDQNLIKWYMDNEVYFSADISEGTPAGGYFTKDAFFLLNLALGGTGTGYTNYMTPNANFQSATMQVDYVRAYQYNSSAPTQAPTQAPTTKASTQAPTQAPSGLVAITDVPLGSWGNFGIYKVYTGDWDGANTAKAGVDPNNSKHIVVNKTNDVYNSAWLTQVKLELPNIPASSDYTYEWPIKAANSDGTVCSSDAKDGDNNQTPLTGQNQTLTGHVEVSDGVACVVVGMGWVNPSNPIEFFEPTIKDKNGNVVYPAQAPTTKAPTTARPTTTQRPTQAPTQAPTVNPGSPDPINPVGLVASCTGDNKISVVWGQTGEMQTLGQLYNVYINGVLRETGTFCRSIDFTDVPAGPCTVKVTATLNGKESSGTSTTFDVTGSGGVTNPPTQAPTTKATTQASTTKAQTQRPTQATTKAPTQAPTNNNTTKAPDVTPTEVVSTDVPATKSPTTTKKPSGKVYVGKAKVKKAKKKSAKKIKVKLKKVKGVSGYLVVVTKKKKSKKILAQKQVKKLKFTFKSKKFKRKKKLYIKARAYIIKNGYIYFGPWSKPKKVKIKK